MSIFLRGKSWYYEFQVRGIRYVKTLGPITRTQAKREEAQAKAQAWAGTLAVRDPVPSPKFATFAAEYLAHCASHLRPTTVRRYQVALDALIAFLGAERLNDILPLTIERYKRQRLELGAAPGTINYELAALSACYTLALQWGRAQSNPVQGVRRYRTTPRPAQLLSPEDEATLLAHCTPALRALVLLALHTGMRAGELTGLRWGQVDLQRRQLTIEAGRAKNHTTRIIPLDRTALAIVQALYTGQASTALVLLNRHGRPWRGALRVFHMAMLAGGLAPCRLHDLRHTFASRLIQAGADLRAVQELLGHSSLAMTARYAHLAPDQTRRAVALLDAVPTLSLKQEKRLTR